MYLPSPSLHELYGFVSNKSLKASSRQRIPALEGCPVLSVSSVSPSCGSAGACAALLLGGEVLPARGMLPA